MQNQRTLLFVSSMRHNSKLQSTPWQLARILARNYRIVYADHPYTFLEALKGIRTRAIFNCLLGYITRGTSIHSGITILSLPFVIPSNFLPPGWLYDTVSALNQWLVARRINGYLKRINCSDLVFINSFDFYFPTLCLSIRSLKLSVYHGVDPIVKKFSLKHGHYLERRAALSSDVVIATAPELVRRFSRMGAPSVCYVPNGVDIAHFKRRPRPCKVKGSSARLTFGYVGNIEGRIDFALITEVLQLLPEWNLVMAGPIDNKSVPEDFQRNERIRFTGPIPYANVPDMLSMFDVAIIPFTITESNKSVYPLKLYEYLAMGLPVVCTPFNPEVLDALFPLVSTSITPFEFARSIRQELETNNELKAEARVSIAKENSWPRRAEDFEQIIETAIAEKQSSCQ